MSDANTMPYRMLGRTGLQVSVFSYGFWATFGVKEGLTDDAGIERAMECLRVARAGGVNLFDNAEVYGSPRGEAERIMGEAIARLRLEDPEVWRRSDILITTKIFWGGDGVNEKGLSRKHILEGASDALDRLQADYVDLIFCHRPDPLTPTETVVRAMTDVVRSGMATAWGTSEWSAQQITEAVWIARTMGLEPPQFEQPQYNLFHRERVEREYHPLFQDPYSLGTTIWSPLMSGVLTGKYNDGIPDGSRMTQLALAWCARNPNVSTVLLGATKPEQLTENLGAIAVARRLTPQHMDAIEAIAESKPDAYGGYGGAGMRDINTL